MAFPFGIFRRSAGHIGPTSGALLSEDSLEQNTGVKKTHGLIFDLKCQTKALNTCDGFCSLTCVTYTI